MSGNSQRHDVEKAVRELLSSRELRDFRDYWALYEQTAAVQNVEGFYVRDDPEHQYCNVAVIGDGRVVDVEGDDGDRSGGECLSAAFLQLTVFRLFAVRSWDSLAPKGHRL